MVLIGNNEFGCRSIHCSILYAEGRDNSDRPIRKVSFSPGSVLLYGKCSAESMSKKDWMWLYTETACDNNAYLEHFFSRDFKYVNQEKILLSWCESVCKKPHILRFEMSIQQAILSRCMYFISLFNRNLKYCGYSMNLFQKRKIAEEQELFYTIRNYEC